MPKRALLIGLGLIVALGTAMYFVSVKSVTTTATGQILKEQQTIARAESSNLSAFFQSFGNSVTVLAESGNSNSFDDFINQWRKTGIVVGVALTDKDGKVIADSNILGTHDTGASLADRDYFSWAKSQTNNNAYFVGQPVVSKLGASKGQMIVPVAAPVFKGGKFNGVVASAVKLQLLTNHYLELMRITNSTDIYLIDTKGNLLYSNTSPDKVGTNAFESLKNQFIGSSIISGLLEKAIAAGKEGSLNASYLGPSGKVEPHLVAYESIDLGNSKWLLVVSSPIKMVSSLTDPIHIRQIASLLLIAMTMFFFGYIVLHEAKRG